jgi:6-phosphogluconolactonase (cycloisomerase 2 family)
VATLGMTAINNQFLYISNSPSNVASQATIDAWSVNLSDGALTTVSGSPFSLGLLSVGQGVAANSTAQVLYVADAGRIDAMKADSSGALTPLSGSPYLTGGNLYLTLDPQNRFLFASNDDPPGSVFAFTVDATSGALTSVAGSPFTISSSSGNTQPAAIAVDLTGQYVYTALPATNQVAAFSIASASGALSPVAGSPFATGNSPVALAAVNGFLYVSNAKDGTTSGYSIDPATGVLTRLAGSPFPIPAGPLVTDFAGRFLFASTAAGMMAFTIDSSSGALTPTGLPVPYSGASVLTYVQ